MTPTEIHFRLMTIRERIQGIESELLVLEDSVSGDARVRLARSGRLLADTEICLAGVATMNHIETELALSIASTREERRHCAAVGASVIPFPGTNGNAG